MAKQSGYTCQQCGFSQIGWAGKCPECDTWGSMVEVLGSSSKKGSSKKASFTSVSLKKLSDYSSTSENSRKSTGIAELDRVLGGGLVMGQVVLLAGEPGVGKSTILLQVANNMGKALYVSGEESPEQVSLRAKRLGIDGEKVFVYPETDVDLLLEYVSSHEGEISFVVVDSIQTLHTSDLSGVSGSIGQVRESSFRLIEYFKSKNIPLMLVGQVTKEKSIAGPQSLAHMVDSVLWIEGDKNLTYRILRSYKNRFGPTDEVGIFEMKESGLLGVSQVDTLFLSQRLLGVSGSVITSIMEGTRPILVEIQVLVTKSFIPIPRRVCQGFDVKRLELLLAVLTKHAKLDTSSVDVFVNVVGGVTIRETAADLAVCLAVASSLKDKALPNDLVALGEVGLMGEIRSSFREKERLKLARREGFKKYVASTNSSTLKAAISRYL